ncbi:MAG: hypothetical protein J6K14_07330 [Clostridia bacterium]|nr:hypothetical protein [Clostridia bacterium]
MRVVLLGGDLNAYSVAISFHAAFGVKSTAFCRYRCGITGVSSIIDVHIEPNILDDAVGTAALLSFAKGMSERPFLVPCGDWYVDFLERNRDALDEHYHFLIPPREVYASVHDKASFYSLLEKATLPYPKTTVLSQEDLSLGHLLSIGEYPAVLKPSDSVAYYAHPFSEMQKVYFPKNPKEAMDISEKIYASGYSGKLILQERIGTKEEPAVSKTLTLFLDREGRVRRGALGEALIEESAAGARGNYAAILSRPPDALTCRLISFLERIGYIGIANFDLLTFKGKTYILELNARQGRSCDYLRACGISLAQFLVDAIGKRMIETDLTSRISLWHAVPFRAVVRRVSAENRALLLSLRRRGRAVSPFAYEGERLTLKRCLYLPVHAVRRTMALKEERKKKA